MSNHARLQAIRDKHPIPNANEEHRRHLSRLDRLAIWITDHVGTMGFFAIIFIWTAVWLGWNSLGPVKARFDPFPGFVLWLFISNMIQIFLMPLIMIGQNLQADHAEKRAEAAHRTVLRMAEETELLLSHLEELKTMIQDLPQKPPSPKM